MLVPVQGGVTDLQKRNRSIFQHEAALQQLEIPNVYIFNVGPREWRNRIGAGKSYNIPACKPGEAYSEGVPVATIGVVEYDPADGGNNMGVAPTSALSGERNGQRFFGVADDIIGKNSTAAALDISTTNLEWFGVFVSRTEVPSEEDLQEARAKLRQMMQLIYARGAEKVQSGEKVDMLDRPRYNEAAAYLGVKPLWGNLDHTRGSCPECHEDIIEGAHRCKHCGLDIDPASVAARAKKREREAAKLLKEENVAEPAN